VVGHSGRKLFQLGTPAIGTRQGCLFFRFHDEALELVQAILTLIFKDGHINLVYKKEKCVEKDFMF